MQPYPYLYAQDPGISPSTASDLTFAGDRASDRHENYSTASTSPPSRKNSKHVAPGNQLSGSGGPGMNASVAGGEAVGHAAEASQAASKPKRVRTGCLTCRERHLKCDEGLPICQNCRKSNRTCKRGLRLNFIDTTVKSPPIMAPIHDWTVSFLDESREIASEYKGGLSRYGASEGHTVQPLDGGMSFDFSATLPPAPIPHHQSLPSIQGMLPEPFHEDPSTLTFDTTRETHHQHAHSHSESTYSGTAMPTTSASTFSNPDQSQQAVHVSRDYMDDPEEVLFMQVFVEEVGLWMDSFDAIKHVGFTMLPLNSR
jgi:hypothetical protein